MGRLHPHRPACVLLGMLASFLVATSAQAVNFATSGALPPRVLAMAGAHDAAGAANGALFGNPAAMARLSLYSLEAGWLRGPRGDDVLYASIVDTKTQALGAGVGYLLVPGDTWVHEGRLAVSYALVPGFIAAGAATRGLFIDRPDGTENQTYFTLDAGLAATLVGGLHAGLVLRNAAREDALDDGRERRYAAGLAWEGGPVQIAADLDWRRATADRNAGFGVQTGLEWMVGEQVAVRGGWGWDGIVGSSVGAGFAIVSAQGGLDLGLRFPLTVDGPVAMAITLKSFR